MLLQILQLREPTTHRSGH